MSQSQAAVEERTCRPLTILSEDERMFRASVREFAEGEVRPRVETMEEHAKLDPTLVKQCFDLGLMSIETPEEYGGGGAALFYPIFFFVEVWPAGASFG